MKKRKHIGLDFDDVIFDMGRSFLAYCSRCHGIHSKPEDMYTYKFEDIWGIEGKVVYGYFQNYITEMEHREAEPISGSIESIKALIDMYDVSIITGRQETARNHTEKWIQKHMPELISRLYFVNSFGDGVGKRDKGDVCRELGIDIFVEDAPVHIASVAKTVPQVYLFDMPWNQKLIDLPENVERVHSWKELASKLLA